MNAQTVKNTLRPIVGAFAIIFTYGCAYFNTFYNANDYFEQGMEILSTASTTTNQSNIPAVATENFKKAILKAQQVIDQFPDSKYISASYYILARSNYYLGEYGLAERYLNVTLADYPDDPRVLEARIYLAKTHYEMGYASEVEVDLLPIFESELASDNILSQVHELNGNIALENGLTAKALDDFQIAAQFAPTDAQKANLYYKIFELLQSYDRVEDSMLFHDQYRKYITNTNDKEEAILTHIRLLQSLGKYEQAYSEVRGLMTLAEFADVVPGLQLELAKIENHRGNTAEYLERLAALKEEYPTLGTAGDASYLMGEYYLKVQRDLRLSSPYFAAVKSSSAYFSSAKSRIKLIDLITSLEKELAELIDVRATIDEDERAPANRNIKGGRFDDTGPAFRREKITEKRGAAKLELAEFDKEREGEADVPLAVKSADQKTPVIDSIPTDSIAVAATGEKAASLLYRIGEIAFIEFEDTTKALNRMRSIYVDYNGSVVTPRAVYFLYLLSEESSADKMKWQSVLFETFGESQFAILAGGDAQNMSLSGLDSLSSLTDIAIQHNPSDAIELFQLIRDRYKTEQSTFAIAYIYDHYVSDLDLAIAGYAEHLQLHPEGNYSDQARDRLADLEDVKASLTE